MSTVSQFPSPSPPVVLHPFLDLFINLSAQTDNAARPFYYCIEAFFFLLPPSLPFLPSLLRYLLTYALSRIPGISTDPAVPDVYV